MFPGKRYFIVVLILSVLFSFWKLGDKDLNEWDESEYGQNAFEMIHNGDYVHYYYNGKIDSWNAKPPLLVWSIVLAYKILGYNAFALRFFSALATVFFFFFAFKLVHLYGNEKLAFITCLILLTCKAVIGFHVGRTGDADALLLLFVTGSLYYFLLFVDFGNKHAIFPAAVFLGLAFYAKGTAAFLLIPGLLLYLIVTGKLKTVIKSAGFWIGISLSVLITLSWVFILLIKGNKLESGALYGSNSVLETLFVHDTFNRLTSTTFDKIYAPDRFLFIRFLDVRFNVWNYFFYLSIFLGVIGLIKKKKFLDEIIMLSICITTPVILLLTFAASTHDWYLAPIALFVSIITSKGIIAICERYNWFNWVWIAVFLFTSTRKFNEINSPKNETAAFFKKNKKYFDEAPLVQLLGTLPQDYFLYLNWYSKKITTDNIPLFKKNSLLFWNRQVNPIDTSQLTLLDCRGDCCLALSYVSPYDLSNVSVK